MQYTVIHNGATYQLPVFTRKIKRSVDEVNDQIMNEDLPLDTRVDALHEFLREIIGDENLEKALGSADLDEVDLNEMNVLYLKITREYDRPVVEFKRPEIDPTARKALAELDRAAKNVTAIQMATSKA